MNPNLTKSCSNCGEVLELEEFPLDRSKGDGHKSRCKECDRAAAKAYYEANRERVLARIKAAYEASVADVPESLRRQSSRRY